MPTKKKNKSLGGWAIAGIVIGAVVGVMLLAVIIYLLLKHIKSTEDVDILQIVEIDEEKSLVEGEICIEDDDRCKDPWECIDKKCALNESDLENIEGYDEDTAY